MHLPIPPPPLFPYTTLFRSYPTSAASAPGQLHLAFGKTPNAYFKPVDAGRRIYREIYWRLYVLHPAQWVGDSPEDRKSTRLNSSHLGISYAVFCLKKKQNIS